jgi:hypothetical protein
VRFCVLGGAHPGPPASSRQDPSPQSAKPAKRPLEWNEKPAGWKPAVPARGARREPLSPHFVGPVRIYQSKHNEAREQAWRDYWLAPADRDQWVEPAPDVYKSTWPLAKRMEAARRALAAPLRYARPLARRLARDAALVLRAVKKIVQGKPWPKNEPGLGSTPAQPPDPDQLE